MKKNVRLSAVAALALSACAAGCGGGGGASTADAGAELDAGAKHDAGQTGDAGAVADAGAMMADWGFRPNPNGFRFPNRGTSRAGETPVTARLTPELLRRLFGPSVCEGQAASGPCRLVPNAQQWMDAENNGAHEGNCEGYTVLAAHFYAGTLDPMTFGAANAYALPLNEALEGEIMFWAVTQSTVDPMVAPQRQFSPRELAAHLERAFAQGRSFLGTSLGVFGQQGGHALLPYALRRRSDTVVEVLVYDNNHPNSERFVTLDTAANTWSYRAALNPSMPDAEWTGSATERPISLRDAGPRRMLPHPNDAWQNRTMDGGGQNRIRINTVGDGLVTVTDGMNRTAGLDAMGRIVSTIPDAAVALRMPGNNSRPDPIFSVPRATPLTVTLDGAGLSAPSPTELLFQGSGWVLGLDNVRLDPGQRDTVVIQPGAPDILYRAAGVETPTLTLAYQSEGDDYLIELRAASMRPGQNLRLSVDFARSTARVSFDGSTAAPNFELYIERVTPTEVIVFDHAGVTATPSAVMGVDFGAWTGNRAPMQITFDDNGDGTVDRTEMLSDDE